MIGIKRERKLIFEEIQTNLKVQGKLNYLYEVTQVRIQKKLISNKFLQ
jgi:hypothetical protein